MKVLYLISGKTHSLGGHYWSLRSLVEAMDGEIDCCVVNVGRAPVGALSGLAVPCWDVPWGRSQLCSAVRRVDHLVRTEKPDVLHSFDRKALFFARMVAPRQGAAIIHTMCGGPNPAGYFPKIGELVLFSQENRDYFASHARFRSTRIHLIPSRVNEVKSDLVRIERLRKGLAPGAMVFLRIATVGLAHQRTSLQTLRLVKQLRQDGLAACFVQVGTVSSELSLARIREEMGPQDRLLTDEGMTFKASEIVEAGDFVVGTGRSFMEAASRSGVMLAPVADAPHPALVTPDNYDDLFRTNFSARGQITGFSPAGNYASIVEAMGSARRREELGGFAGRMFEQDFSMAAAVPKYVSLYGSVRPSGGESCLDLAVHAAWTLKHW